MIKIFMGKSGAGKDFLLQKELLAGRKPIISFTTRPMRDGERQGREYNFVSKEEFSRIANNGGMIQVRSYNTVLNGRPDVWSYGSPEVNPKEDYTVILDAEGTIFYTNYYSAENIEVIFVTASDETRLRRAKARGGFDEKEWNRRLQADTVDFSDDVIKKVEEKLGKPVVVIDNEKDFVVDNL